MTVSPTIRQMIYQSYERDVKNSISSRRIFLNVNESTDAISHAISCVATILAFSAGFFDSPLLSYGSGVSGAISLALLRYSVYAKSVAKEKTQSLNRILTGNSDEADSNEMFIPETNTPTHTNSNSNTEIKQSTVEVL